MRGQGYEKKKCKVRTRNRFLKRLRRCGVFLFLAAYLSLALLPAAQAADDFLSILDNKPQETKSEGTESPVRTSLVKLLGVPSAEQNIFIEFLAQREPKKALYQWPSAFAETSFSTTPSGRALNAYLLFANGLEVTGLEALLTIDKADEIDPAIRSLWKESASAENESWSVVQVQSWSPVWTDVFGTAVEVRVRGRSVYGVNELPTVRELLQKAALGTPERAWLEWQAVMSLISGSDAALAGRALSQLMKATNNPVSVDLMTMTAARLLYQNGYMDAAIKYYEKISKSSDYWFEAQEEMGWAYIRKGEPQNAIALTKTLIHPTFASQVGPETLFLRSLALLKVCDYQEVVQTLKTFRERYRDRVNILKSLATQPSTPASQRLVNLVKSGPVTLKSLGGDAAYLPRFVTRDEIFKKRVMTEKQLDSEAKRAADLYGESLSGGTGQVGFQARFEYFKKAVESRQFSAHSAALDRVKWLAEEESKEIVQILQKLHIVEAEVIQQLSLVEKLSLAKSTGSQSSKNKGTSGVGDKIWFPSEGETWFDELANYRVDVKKGCQSLKR